MPRAFGTTNAAPYAAAPAVGAAGDSYFNTTDKSLYQSDGIAWGKIGPVAPGVTVPISATAPASPATGALWFRSDPDANLYIRYDDGNTVQWVPASPYPAQLWSVSATTGGNITPAEATKRLVVPGPTTAEVTDQSALVIGTRTQKARLMALPGVDSVQFTKNRAYTGSAWVRDDTGQPSWSFAFPSNDTMQVTRGSAAGVDAALLLLEGNGKLTLSTDLDPLIVMGSTAMKGSFSKTAGALTAQMNHPWGSDDLTKSGWMWQLDALNDQMITYRRAPSAPAGTVTSPLIVSGTGNLTITGATATKAAGGSGTAWATTSDRRIKEQITDYSPGLAAVLRLCPRAFVYNGKGGSTAGRPGWGFIADELAPVFPEAVDTYRGKLGDEETDIQRVDVSNVTLALVNAVKELSSRLVAVEARCP